jgi:hypothetical protein
MPETTEPDERTLEAERTDAGRLRAADRPPTPPEESDADSKRLSSDATQRKSVAEHYAEMAELGAKVKGEGRIS